VKMSPQLGIALSFPPCITAFDVYSTYQLHHDQLTT
jgi:hypothetical protein